MVYCSCYFQALLIFDGMDLKLVADPLDSMTHIHTSRLEIILLISYGKGDIL